MVPPATIKVPLIARLMGPTWGPSGTDRTQLGPLLAPLTLLSALASWRLPFCSDNITLQFRVCTNRKICIDNTAQQCHDVSDMSGRFQKLSKLMMITVTQVGNWFCSVIVNIINICNDICRHKCYLSYELIVAFISSVYLLHLLIYLRKLPQKTTR